MGQHFDVVVISAHGRSLGLALELQSKGLSVGVVDLTSRFLAWDLSDWEGPFGVFESKDELSDAQKKVNQWQSELHPLPRGFTIYDQHGVVEYGSPLSEFLIGKAKIYNTKWLDSLAASAASAEWRDFNDDVEGLTRLPVDQPWFQRVSTVPKIAESLQIAQQNGVKVFSETILDAGLQKGAVESLQLAESGIVTAYEFVWALSQEDILKLPPAVSSRVYPRGVLAAQGCWLRYQFSWTLGGAVMRPPGSLVVLGHRELPWSHGNLLFVEDIPSVSTVQIWVRIPIHSRFLRSRMDELAEQIKTTLSGRWPITHIELRQLPREYDVDMSELGAPRLPLFNPEELKRRPKPVARNWIETGPEAVGSLNWNSRWNMELKVAKEIVERFKRRVQAKSSQEASP